jgi:iron complex transport system substrate-binding protein
MAAKRIASLLASGTEMLYALGLGDRVVAVSHECDFPADAINKPRVTATRIAAEADSLDIDRQVRAAVDAGAALYDIDRRRLVDLLPDLIVTQAQCDVCAVRYQDVLDLVRDETSLRETRVVALDPRDLQGVFDDILRVGSAAGADDQATKYVAELRGRVEAIRRRAAEISRAERPRVACLEWLDPLMVAGNWMPELIEIAGGVGGLSRGGQHSPAVSWEALAAFDPQAVVLMPCGFDLSRTRREAACLLRLPGWSELAAVRAGRVFAVDGNAYFNRSGPRMVESLEVMAHLLHPAVFSPPPLIEAWGSWPGHFECL